MLDDGNFNKTERPVYLVLDLFIVVLIQVSVFVLRTHMIMNDVAHYITKEPGT